MNSRRQLAALLVMNAIEVGCEGTVVRPSGRGSAAATASPPAPPATVPSGTATAPPHRPPVASTAATPARDACRDGRANIPGGDVCLVLEHARIVYRPTDGRAPVAGPRLSFPPDHANGSIGLRDGYLYLCNTTVTRVSLTDGSSEMTDVPCLSVTADASGILVFDNDNRRLARYADHASLVAHRIADRFDLRHASRIALAGTDVISAWHSTHELLVGPPGGPRRAIQLAGFDDWIMGLDRLDDGRFVIGTREGVRVFASDGSVDRVLSSRDHSQIEGLVCGKGEEFAALESCPLAPHPKSRPLAGCSSPADGSNYSEATTGDGELHVVGIYEAAGADAPRGPCVAAGRARSPNERSLPTCAPASERKKVTIRVKPTPRPMTLLLSSYDPVHFVLDVAPNARIAKIVVQGNTAPTISGQPKGVPITTLDGQETAFGWEVAHNTGGSSFATFMSGIRSRHGRETTFQGCYAATAFDVPYM